MFCKYEGEPKDGAPPVITLTSGFFCGLYGTTHPLCRLFDVIIPIPGVLSLIKKYGLAIKGLRYLAAVKATFDQYDEENIPTPEFCRFYPDVQIEDIVWLDIVSALTPFNNGELSRKVAAYTAVQLWNDNCQCKAKRDADQGSDDLNPLPVPPIPEPGSDCAAAYDLYRLDVIVSNAGRVLVLAAFDQNPNANLIEIIKNSLTADDLVNGFPSAYWRPTISQQAPDSEGCYCFFTQQSSQSYRFDRDIIVNNRLIPPEDLGFATSWKFLRWCTPPPPPDDPSGLPIFDPDFLTDFCDIFPEVEACVKCGGAEHQETDVMFHTACDQSGIITWGIDVVSGGGG